MKKILLIILSFAIYGLSLAQQQDTICPNDSPDADKLFQDNLLKEMDELLDLWYIKKQLGNNKTNELTDNSEADCLIDSVISERLLKIRTVIPLQYNEAIRSKIELYVCKRKKSSSIILGLTQYYYPWMREIFDKYNVPEELIYLTIVESAMNPVAVSRAGATGIWQFMYATGKMYGLEVNTFVDDRRDPFKATDAAARHLRDLYKIFNDWGLAISAYNCGAGGVRKAIARSKGKTDFWGVKPCLPKETQNYFPYYVAAMYLATYNAEHGIPLAEIKIPFSVDTVMIKKELHLDQVAAVLQIDVEELKILNPQYKRLIIPAYTTPYPLRLKNADILKFIALQDSIYEYNKEQYFAPVKVYEDIFTGNKTNPTDYQNIYHTVKQGESLGSIANKYGLSVVEIKKMNKLNSSSIKPKQRLLVGYEYIKKVEVKKDEIIVTDTLKNKTESVKIDSIPQVQQKANTNTPIIHIVKKGESLSSIAAKYKTTSRKIADYNKLTNINTIAVGQKLRIP